MPSLRQCCGTTSFSCWRSRWGQVWSAINWYKNGAFQHLACNSSKAIIPCKGASCNYAMDQGDISQQQSWGSSTDVAQWIWTRAPFSSQNRDKGKKGYSPWIPPRVILKEGEIKHEEQTERLVWQSPLPLSLNLTYFYIHREFLNKNPLILIVNNLIVHLIWRINLPLVHLKEKRQKNTATNMKIVGSSH